MALPPDRSATAHLADVIPLLRPPSHRGDPTEATLPALGQAVDLLERRCGSRWAEVPASLGRLAADAERLLADGPTALAADTLVVRATSTADPIVTAAAALAALIDEEAHVLGQALGADLGGLPLAQLHNVAGSVLDLGLATELEPAWATRATADAAAVVLASLEAELRTTARLHHDLYADFTEHVLEIRHAHLRAARRPWRVLARARARRHLVAASRTGRLPGGLGATVRHVLAVREARDRLAELAPLLSTHLARTGWGPLADVDAVASSLAAVQRFQSLLGDRLDPARLADLLSAVAFQSPVLVLPASRLRMSLGRWHTQVTARGGAPWALTAGELGDWAARAGASLQTIRAGAAAMEAIGRPLTTVRALVGDLLLRELADELAIGIAGTDVDLDGDRRLTQGSTS